MLRRIIASVVVASLGVSAAATAQTDYRNLDDDRPAVVEDAYPAERWAIEFVAPLRAEQGRDGRRVLVSVPELTVGAFANVHIGLKAPIAQVRTTDGVESAGLSGLRLFGLWNFNTESGGLPALALRADAVLPVGPLAETRTAFVLKGVATRSFGVTRLHANASVALGRLGAPAAAEGASRWLAALALDHTWWRHSLLGLVEVAAKRERAGAPLSWVASAGTRVQLSPILVLDAGVGRELAADRGGYVTLGLTRHFALDGLMRRVP